MRLTGRASGGLVLALDAGGSKTRAVLVDGVGRLLGHGLASGGNPVAVGAIGALAAHGAAAREAIRRSAHHDPAEVAHVVLATAGGDALPADDGTVLDALWVGGGTARLHRVGDALAMYHSATTEPEGIVVAAGTGAVAVHYRHLEPVRMLDGNGWLIGDAGSGFWIGRRVVRAVARAIDGTGPTTALTGTMLAALGLLDTREVAGGRPVVLSDLVARVHAEPPVTLARLAPLAFAAAAQGDEVAARITADAEEALARLVSAVREGIPHLPVVLGGSVLLRGLVGAGAVTRGRGPLADSLVGTDVHYARDAVAGAALVGLLALGRKVSEDELSRMAGDIAATTPQEVGNHEPSPPAPARADTRRGGRPVPRPGPTRQPLPDRVR